MSEFNLSLFEHESIEAVIKGMKVVRAYQLRDKTIGEAIIKKTDDTFLTVADRECGEVLRAYVRGNFPGIRTNIEDVGESAEQSVVTIYGDPVDGTAPLTIGLPTSTVILGAYATATKKMLACTIGEPASGRLWYTRNGRAYAATWDFETDQLRNERRLKVWTGELSSATAVFLDNCQGFKRSGRQIMTDQQVQALMARLSAYRLLMAGSNGAHQAIVAQGNDKMAGAITSAIGGPQDVCGVKLVLNAGGAARAFRMSEERQLVEMPPQAIEDYDILVLGNSQATVDKLTDILFSVI